MIRYMLVAAALKCFALSPMTRKVYRALGDHYGGPLKRRERYISSHITRGNLFRNLCDKYQVLVGGEKLLEIGTGWVHWHSLYHRLFYDVEISMLDIWDCRQLNALQTIFSDVKQILIADGQPDEQVLRRIDAILKAESFEKLYKEFNLDYALEGSGSLERYGDDTLDCIFSFHVLEHVPRENTADLISNIYRALKPGGYSIHQIGIDDHLAHYDGKVSPKNYIRYSDKVWRGFFENTIQYFNRMQMSEWLHLYDKNGFTMMESQPVYCELGSLPVHARFKDYSQKDLQCITLTIVHQKPE